VARYRAAWANLSMPGQKGPLLRIHDAFEVGDRVVNRFTMSGVQSGNFDELSSDGQELRSAWNYDPEVRDGKVVERWSCTDRLTQLLQLGVLRLLE
jgi:predicted ester cyclase